MKFLLATGRVAFTDARTLLRLNCWQYDKGWAAVNRLIRAGRSFSGREAKLLFSNLGPERFANVSSAPRSNLPDDGRGLALTDWDWDGRVDFWMTNRNGPRIRFLKNEYQTAHDFLRCD